MLSKQPWLRYSDGFENELLQAEEEGRAIPEELADEHKGILNMDGDEKQGLAREFYNKVQSLKYRDGYPYNEPNDLSSIKALRPEYDVQPDKSILDNEDKLFDRVKGAWFGRCAGCLLGKPVEGWMRDNLRGFLTDTGNYPINYYMSSDISEELLQKHKINKTSAWINNVSFMPEDDDTNYTVIGLKLLQSYGKDFTAEDAAECWLNNLPILHVCTAERVAYRNLVNLVFPPDSASYCNPYREWIGAQIRADFFGYITPANPELGAEYAHRDASISHVKNGIYGEMWVAAMLSAAAGMNAGMENAIENTILAGLGQIPEKCRLAEDILQVIEWKKQALGWEDIADNIHKKYNEHNSHYWCHTNSNAMIVANALLQSGGDLEKAISIAVMSGFDTDCNGATAGSVIGMLVGYDGLPQKWIAPLSDTIISGVDGFGKVSITYLAEATMKFI